MQEYDFEGINSIGCVGECYYIACAKDNNVSLFSLLGGKLSRVYTLNRIAWLGSFFVLRTKGKKGLAVDCLSLLDNILVLDQNGGVKSIQVSVKQQLIMGQFDTEMNYRYTDNYVIFVSSKTDKVQTFLNLFVDRNIKVPANSVVVFNRNTKKVTIFDLKDELIGKPAIAMSEMTFAVHSENKLYVMDLDL